MEGLTGGPVMWTATKRKPWARRTSRSSTTGRGYRLVMISRLASEVEADLAGRPALLRDACSRALAYLNGLGDRPVAPAAAPALAACPAPTLRASTAPTASLAPGHPRTSGLETTLREPPPQTRRIPGHPAVAPPARPCSQGCRWMGSDCHDHAPHDYLSTSQPRRCRDRTGSPRPNCGASPTMARPANAVPPGTRIRTVAGIT